MSRNDFTSQGVSRLARVSGAAKRHLTKIDWTQTRLGPPDAWPDDLNPYLELCFRSAQPSVLVWGTEQGHLYNQAWADSIAQGNWDAIGSAFGETWAEIWPGCQSIYHRAQTGESVVALRERVFAPNSDGQLMERYFNFSATPVKRDSEALAAVLITAQDVTRECLAERRLRMLRELADQYVEMNSVEANCQWFLEMIVRNRAEVPFAAVYWVEAQKHRAVRLCSVGADSNHDVLPPEMELGSGKHDWGLLDTVQRKELTVLSSVPEHLGKVVVCEPYPEAIQAAALYPVTSRNRDFPPAVLLMAASPRLSLDEDYRGFFTLLGISFRQLMTGAYTRSRWEEANAALIASERRYRAIVEGQSEMVCRFRSDGTIVFANGAYARACNTTPELLEGGNFWDYVAKDDHTSVQALLAQIRPDHPEVYIENQFEIAGRYHWTRWSNRGLSFDDQGRPTEVQSVGMDISDRRRAEQALQEREEQLRLALRSANAGVWSLDVASGTTFWSQEFRSLYGYQPDTRPDIRTWIERIHPHDKEWVKSAFRTRPFSTNSEYQQEFRILHPQRGERWILALGRVERNEAGGAQRISGINIDITERKAVEQALRESEERLKEADRRKDEFLATLAHELRNPLAPMRNSLEVMRLAGENKTVLEEARVIMERQLAHMVHLINDLLDLSRISRGKVTLRKNHVSIAAILQQAVEICRPLIDEAAQNFILNLPSQAVYVDADQARLAQVFANLLSNATKFTPVRGHIRLAAEIVGDSVEVKVQDDGRGIPPRMLDKIFDMFMQGEPNDHIQGGLGIGLSLVKGLVEMHGGQVKASSGGINQGSEFVVRLPIIASGKTEKPESKTNSGRSAAKLRILVVDDNRDAANSMATMLELMGNEIRIAFDGLEALEVAAQFHPDFVLLDIGMPNLNGYETAQRMRQQTWGAHIKLVALTGWGQAEDRRRSKEAGFDAHLVKPVDLVTLGELLNPEEHE